MMGWLCACCSSPHDGKSRGYCKPKCADLDRHFVESGEHIHPIYQAAIKERLAWFDAEIEEAHDDMQAPANS